MMNATEPVMKSLQAPIRTEDEVPQNAQRNLYCLALPFTRLCVAASAERGGSFI